MSDLQGTDYHEWLYSDLKRVKAARVQAKGRIAQRRLYLLLVESWAAPTIAWLSKRLERRRG